MTAGMHRPAIVLLHGLGATGAVWHRTEQALRALGYGAIIAPDLPGHGAAAPEPTYTVGSLAAAVAAVIPPDRPWCVFGHSLGGYVALALASGWFGPVPVGAGSLGAKLRFTDDDRARARELAARPARVFASRAEAIDRYRRVAGLTVALAPDEACLERGVSAAPGGFRLAQDPASFAVTVPAFDALIAAAVCPVVVARGALDSLVSREDCADLPRPVEQLAGLGHNAHVEDPERSARLISRLAAPGI